MSQSEAARRLGLTPQAIGLWARKPGAPVGSAKGRPFCRWPDFPRWWKEQDGKARKTADFDLAEAERRERQARTEIVEMKRDLMRGELARRKDFDAELREMAGRLKGAVLGLKSQHLRRMIGLENEVQAAAALDGITRDLLDALQGVADDEEEGFEEEPAA